ncbi:nuclease SbcCD subunit D [Caldalkalibacillus thermarum]|uniref:exonuclease SbcCD subunit D n=1 Tax=Caldalkalibacillus thermarum TaxID=296745 RepID=UPI00166C7333|nr:exonuclease SbcCD subunit D [Caldalkalibacillus thermarum]GGK28293.1 nuclease SbcCD subunit D [Caldalkalibacillus thermarum]
MRLLHTADWHLGRTLEGRSRLDEQAQFLDELYEIVVAEKIDAILIAGDVFDTFNPPAAAEQLFYDSLSRLADKGKRPVVVIAGNHDHPDRLSAAVPLAREQGITILGYPTEEVQHIFIPQAGEELRLAALAYPSESRLNELLAQNHDETVLRDEYDQRIRQVFANMARHFAADTVNVAMSHLYVAGGSTTESERPIEVGGAYTVRATSLPSAAQYVALGHLHRPQDVKKALAPARYSGSPLAFSFSETGYAKSVTVVDVKPGSQAQVHEIHLSSGKPLVRWKAEEGLAAVYHWIEEGRDKNAWIDLEVHVEHALSLAEIHRLRKLHPGLIHIRPVFPEQEHKSSSQREANLPIDELFKRFYQHQTGGPPEEGLVRLFLELVNEQREEEEA